MRKVLYILILSLACANLSASAQNHSERGDVRSGNRQYNKGNYAAAAERYGEALRAAPGCFEAGYNLGNTLYKSEQYEKSEQTLTRFAADSLRAAGERSQAFYNLGNAQFKQKKYKEALESYKQAMRFDPTDKEAKYNYAYTKRLLDQNKDDKGGGGQNNQDKDKQNQEQQNQQNGNDQKKQSEKGDQKGDKGQNQEQNGQPDKQQGEQGEPQQGEGKISKQESDQMLNAIQAQEDKTQDKLKEKKGVMVRGKKNW